MAGVVALLALALFIVSIVVVFSVGFHAATRRPTMGNLRPELASKYTTTAFVFVLVAVVSGIVGFIAGIVWIVQAITA